MLCCASCLRVVDLVGGLSWTFQSNFSHSSWIGFCSGDSEGQFITDSAASFSSHFFCPVLRCVWSQEPIISPKKKKKDKVSWHVPKQAVYKYIHRHIHTQTHTGVQAMIKSGCVNIWWVQSSEMLFGCVWICSAGMIPSSGVCFLD